MSVNRHSFLVQAFFSANIGEGSIRLCFWDIGIERLGVYCDFGRKSLEIKFLVDTRMLV